MFDKEFNPLLIWIGVIFIGAVLVLSIGSDAPPQSSESAGQTVAMPRNEAAEDGPLRLVDVAPNVGLGDFQHGAFRWGFHGDPIAMMGGGLCWIDYDLDGWLDLYVVNSYAVNEAGRWQAEEGGLPRSALFKNEAGRFTNVSEASGAGVEMRGNGCVAADLNRDGWPDLYVTTARSNLLFWNNGDGTFTEGATAAGVAAYGWQTAAVVGDLNQDGWLDLFLAGYVDPNARIESATMGFPNTHLGRRDLLYLSQGLDDEGIVTFREVGEIAGVETKTPYEYGLGALLTDVDRDGDLDLFVANDTNPNRLYENQLIAGGAMADPEGLGFRLVPVENEVVVNDRNSGMGVAGGDFNGDGLFDLMVTNLGDQLHSVYQNDGGAEAPLSFMDAAGSVGVDDFGAGWTGWGSSWIDLDQDTDLDLVVVNGRVPVVDFEADAMIIQYFDNQTAQGRAGQLRDATAAVGLDLVGAQVGRGSAAADYDNDGDVDIAVASIGGPLRLLENQGQKGQWLTVAFDGPAAGAVVRAELADGTTIEREMHVGSSYLASEDPRCHLGLGEATAVETLTVFWPDGHETVQHNVSAGQIVWLSP